MRRDEVDEVHVLFGGLKCAAGLLLDIGLACGGILPTFAPHIKLSLPTSHG